MSSIQVILPKMGESVAEATITKWLKKVGETIKEEESLVEIATDKVDSEVPSPAAGVLLEIKFQEGQVAKVGEIIALIGNPADRPIAAPAIPEAPKVESPLGSTMTPSNTQELRSVHGVSPVIDQNTDKFFSPLVRNIAKQEGISLTELDQMGGTGKDGRVTKKDILEYVQNKRTDSPQAPVISEVIRIEEPQKLSAVSISETKTTPQILPENVEIIEMDRMRKLIAEHMVKSKQTSPHVTSFVEVDVTNLVQWREKIKSTFEKKEGEKITFTPLFIEAVVKALKDFPLVNVSVDGVQIIRKKFINIGVATALPSGNLIVPVIKNADRLNLAGITKSCNDLIAKARTNKLQPDEIQGGTFTLTNVGTFGNLMGTPIINQPQVAILATGAIKKKPAVIETPSGDFIGVRQMMFLSLSYDHRVVDGALGGSFLRRIADYLEQFDINREI